MHYLNFYLLLYYSSPSNNKCKVLHRYFKYRAHCHNKRVRSQKRTNEIYFVGKITKDKRRTVEFYLQAIVLPLSSTKFTPLWPCVMMVTCLQGWNEISTRKIAVWCAPVKRTWSFNCLLSDVRCPPKEKSFPRECIAREEHSSMNFVNKGLQLRTPKGTPSLGFNFSLVIGKLGISFFLFPSFKISLLFESMRNNFVFLN